MELHSFLREQCATMQLRRFVPQFSLRTLAVFVLILSAYFGAWEATKLRGVPHFPSDAHVVCPAPFIVQVDELAHEQDDQYVIHLFDQRSFHFWFFGIRAKLMTFEVN
jgi:hypothetical protein